MSRKPSLLASAIKTAEQPAAASAVAETTETATEPKRGVRSVQPAGSYVAPSRANKTAKTHYLPPAYWETLEEVSFRTRDPQGKRIPQERLVAEALNLLFAKYNFPLVREGGD
ncbi:MAG: chromosome partitioning protein ParB [Pseudolabrys sp.]|nr:chromosome partitioning protein ParB [Pseudolabrys sp.]